MKKLLYSECIFLMCMNTRIRTHHTYLHICELVRCSGLWRREQKTEGEETRDGEWRWLINDYIRMYSILPASVSPPLLSLEPKPGGFGASPEDAKAPLGGTQAPPTDWRVLSPKKKRSQRLRLATNRWRVVKCVSQKRNESNDYNQRCNNLLTFIF